MCTYLVGFTSRCAVVVQLSSQSVLERKRKIKSSLCKFFSSPPFFCCRVVALAQCPLWMKEGFCVGENEREPGLYLSNLKHHLLRSLKKLPLFEMQKSCPGERVRLLLLGAKNETFSFVKSHPRCGFFQQPFFFFNGCILWR